MRVFEQSISGEKVVGFLRHVLREISGKLTIVEADDRLGWASGPPGTNSQGISCRGGVPAPSTGATARLRPRSESGRGGLELAQERRDEEPLLSRSRSPQSRTPKSEGAASPQDPDHQELFPGGRISLNTFSRIGKSADSRLPLANWPPFPVARGDGFSVARCTGQRGRHESAGGEAGRRKPSRSRDDIVRDNPAIATLRASQCPRPRSRSV